MAPFDRAMNWLQMEAAQDPVIAPMGGAGNGGGNGSSWLNYGEPPSSNPPAYVPPIPGSPLGQVNVGGQPFVAPPSNERSHEQYMMDLQNEREAEYIRNNPPPVTVASLGGSPLANPGFQGAAAGPADTQL